MTGVNFLPPIPRYFSISGAILPGWTATFFLSETDTPADVYADGSLSTSLGNEVEADDDGHMQPVWLDPDVVYRVQIRDADGVLQPDGDVDPIDVSRGSGGGGSGPPIAQCRANGNGTLQSGSTGIESVVRDSEGTYIVTFEDGFFSATPACVATLWDNDESATIVFIANPSTTEVTVKTFSDSGLSPDDGAFHLICVGTT